jgi:hypothetical protein
MAFSGSSTDSIRSQATIVDPASIYESLHQIEQQEEEERRRMERAEFDRIDRMVCPVCHSNGKTRHNIVKDNGVFGPGYESHVVMTYYVCDDCGVHYSDLKKKKA